MNALLKPFVAAAAVLSCHALAAPPLQLPPGCLLAQPGTCAYQPPLAYSTANLDSILLDPARNNHPVPFRIRYPVGAVGPLPVVVWNHGGGATVWDRNAPGPLPISKGQQSSAEHGESFASRGYVAIHIGRLPAENLTPSQKQDCVTARLRFVPAGNPPAAFLERCSEFIGTHIYGAQNVAFLMAALQAIQAQFPNRFPVTMDFTRIVVGGWSGGSAVPLGIAGAFKQFNGLRVDAVTVPGVIGFIASSPRGTEWGDFESGFVDEFPEAPAPQVHSFQSIDARPFLAITGVSDRGKDKDAFLASRTAWFWSGTPGQKYQSYALENSSTGGPVHGTMDLGECGGSHAKYCRWFDALQMAYLDAVVKGLPLAVSWLASDAYRVLTRFQVELQRR